MDTDQLLIFSEVAKRGSFAEAARKLERDPSQISRAIANLESHLGIRLFQRTTRNLSLTEGGKRYLIRVSSILDELDYAEEEAKALSSSPSGVLTMTASIAFGQQCLLPLLDDFRKKYPDIQLDLKLTDSNLDLLTNDIDLACRLTPAFDSNLIGFKLFDTRYKICASPNYIKDHSLPHRPSDLQDHDCLVFSMPHYRSRWIFKDNKDSTEHVNIRSSLAISSALALLECTLSGMGPALLADWMVNKHIANGQLVDLYPDYRVTATDFSTAAWLLYPSRKMVPTKTRVMLEYLKDYFAKKNS